MDVLGKRHDLDLPAALLQRMALRITGAFEDPNSTASLRGSTYEREAP